MAAAFARAAALFGIEVVDTRPFVLGSDPREREMNDLDFLTGSARYDVVFVADIHGEFALGVPYRTQRPVPVIGAAGLVPRVWHWSYTRHGAPQVHGRFERLHGRRMGEADWGAWLSLKIIGEAVARTKSREVADIIAYLRGDEMRIDGSKGPGMSFRAWSSSCASRSCLPPRTGWRGTRRSPASSTAPTTSTPWATMSAAPVARFDRRGVAR